MIASFPLGRRPAPVSCSKVSDGDRAAAERVDAIRREPFPTSGSSPTSARTSGPRMRRTPTTPFEPGGPDPEVTATTMRVYAPGSGLGPRTRSTWWNLRARPGPCPGGRPRYARALWFCFPLSTRARPPLTGQPLSRLVPDSFLSPLGGKRRGSSGTGTGAPPALLRRRCRSSPGTAPPAAPQCLSASDTPAPRAPRHPEHRISSDTPWARTPWRIQHPIAHDTSDAAVSYALKPRVLPADSVF